MRRLLLILTLLLCSSVQAANMKLDFLKLYYYFNNDGSYTLTVTQKLNVLSSFGAEDAQKTPITYYPDTESFKLLGAYVIKSDARKIPVKHDQIFTRTASDDSNAPGFNSRMTTTVVYPNLSANDTTFIQYQIQRKKPLEIGFSTVLQSRFGIAQRKQTIVLDMPKQMMMKWAKHGSFKVKDNVVGERRVISATIMKQPEIYSENMMADLGDNLPYFIASSVPSWNAIGENCWNEFKDKIVVTPKIKALAAKLTENKHGKEAARAIYNWVAKNIHYIAVYLDEGAGIRPHSASEILANGYGDCKDKTVLTITLLSAAGIEAYPTLIHVGDEFYNFPIPNSIQFNHAMVYIPKFNLFANPTNEFTSFGELDAYTSNKFVVIAAPKPHTAKTPQSNSNDSRYVSNKKLTIDEKGNVKGQAKIHLSGRVNQTCRSLFNGAVLKILAKSALEETEGGIGSIHSSDPTDLNHDMTITANWKSPSAINIDQDNINKKSYFTIPVGIDLKSPISVRHLIQYEKRKYPALIGAGILEWHYVIDLPNHFSVSHLPKNIHFTNAAGHYDSEYVLKKNQLSVNRMFVINKDVYTPKEYSALKALLFEPVRDGRSVVSMVR